MLIDFLTSSYMTLVILFFLAVILFVNRKAKIPAASLVKTVMILILFLKLLEYGKDLLIGITAYQIDIPDFQLRVTLRTVFTTLVYVLRPFVIMLELFVICPNKKIRLLLAVPTIVNTVIYLPTVFGFGIAFSIGPDNQWESHYPFNLTIYIVMLLYVLMLLLLSVNHFLSHNRSACLIVLAIFIVSVVTAALEYTNTLTQQTTTVTALSVLVYYIYLSIIYQRNIRQTIEEKELEIAKSELTILKNQMQPHFIFNTLATIRLLAKRDSKKAVKCIDDFSKYLKSHIGAIQNEDLIPFSEELENVKVYLSIVQECYNSDIDVIYETDVTEFSLPPLSLEPVVENAVSHGIGRMGGTITIRTFTDNDRIIIRVTDSGSKENPEEDYKPYHNGIGLENTAKRLELHCGGELRTDFSGDGGIVDVILPAGKEKTV